MMSIFCASMDTADDVFEKFVSRVDEKITEQEKNIMKQFAEDYLGQELQHTLSCREIIQLLNEKTHMNDSSNLALLKNMFFKLGRKDLVKLAIEYKTLISKTRQTPDESEIKEKNGVSVTVRYEYSSFMECQERAEELVHKLSDLVFAPVNHIKVTRIEPLSSGGFLCVLLIHEIYADIFQELLQDKNTNTGLNHIGVTDVFIYNTTHKIKGKLVPVEMLQEHQRVISLLSKQNEEFVQRLDQLGKSLDSLLPLIAELGDPKTHLKNLEHLHKHAGFSTTLWKTIGRLSDDQMPEKYKPDYSQEEIRQRSLYSKARMQRIFPNLSEPSKKH